VTVTTTGTGPRGCDNDGVDGTSGGGRRRPRTPARPGRAPRHALGTPRVRRSRARHPCRGGRQDLLDDRQPLAVGRISFMWKPNPRMCLRSVSPVRAR
jgi:hypothetical protein